MGFDQDYQSFLKSHLQGREGDRLRRLQDGQHHAETMFLKQVWWPLFHHFDFLHPEYEVYDFKDGTRYLDFAYIREGIRICIEIDGYGPHVKSMSRWQFDDSLERQNQLIIDGWAVIRFSYDQVTNQPRRCQQVIQQIIGRMLGEELDQFPLSCMEKEVIRFAMKKCDAITPGEISKLMNLSSRPVRRLLSQLVQKRILLPSSGKQRIRSYRLGENVKTPFR